VQTIVADDNDYVKPEDEMPFWVLTRVGPLEHIRSAISGMLHLLRAPAQVCYTPKGDDMYGHICPYMCVVTETCGGNHGHAIQAGRWGIRPTPASDP
jgi:hypothetical protein